MKNDETHFYTIIILWNSMRITTSVYTSKKKMLKDLTKLSTVVSAFMVYETITRRVHHYCKDKVVKAGYNGI